MKSFVALCEEANCWRAFREEHCGNSSVRHILGHDDEIRLKNGAAIREEMPTDRNLNPVKC
jgi:hypothetical protein